MMQPKPFDQTAAAKWRPRGVRRRAGGKGGPPRDHPGLFGDRSVYRRVTGEGVLLAGGAAALLLQLAHPGVARGVAEHSDFAANGIARLRGTLEFVYVVAFGSREEAERLSAAVRRMHHTVAGPGYRADDPELQVWVNATLFATALRIYCSIFGALNDDEMEEFWAGAKLLAGMLGCPENAGPRTVAEFFPYWDRMVTSLEVTDTARELAQTILYSPWPGFSRPFSTPLSRPVSTPLSAPLSAPVQAAARFVTAGLLPAPIREQYGMVWSPGRERLLAAGTALTRVVYPRLPRAVRQAPKAYCLRGLRARRPASP